MIIGQYVRCPIILEEADETFPRSFILAKVKYIDEISNEVDVTINDLFGSKKYYEHVFVNTRYNIKKVFHCAASKGCTVSTPFGIGVIQSRDQISGDDDYYNYYIQLNSGECQKFQENELKIDYTALDYSPLKQLYSYEFQNPSWYANRIIVSRNMHMISNAVYGFQTLAGCRTYLLEHQISTVTRCFEFRPIRYMLADEVGLGKTIEACSIIRILSTENSGLKVLYIIPGTLMQQWANELSYKFNITINTRHNLTTSAQHVMLALEDLTEDHIIFEQKWDLVLVDETHRLLNNSKQFDMVLCLSKSCENILLLSATPIQDRKEEYLRLLTLLNPLQYEKMSTSKFSQLVLAQQSIQRRVNLILRRIEKYDEYKETIRDQLQSLTMHFKDKHLDMLVGKIDLLSEDSGLEITQQVLSYICENYRIERRVIRNRREMLREVMARRILDAQGYYPFSSEDSYNEQNTLQSLLEYLSLEKTRSDEFVMTVAEPLLGAFFSSPWALIDEIRRQGFIYYPLEENLRIWIMQAENEIGNVNYILDEDPDMKRGRLLFALDYLEQETNLSNNKKSKFVIFTGYNATLQKFYELLCQRKIGAVVFGNHMSREDLETSVYEFQNNDDCQVIICDELGGEGRNFQIAELILHLDIPWTANALEQRIGRLDRIGRPADSDVLSIVFYSKETIEEQLFEIWNKGMNLFQQSLSGLEIVTGEINRLICKALAEDFYTGLSNAVDDILAVTEEMRETVTDEQLYDVGSTIYRPLSQAVKQMLSVYSDGENSLLEEAMTRWSTQAGLIPEYSQNLVEFREKKFSPRSAIQSLLIPPHWKDYSNAHIVKRANKILGTFDRSVAIKREDLLFFAPRDPVFEAIISNAINSGRGRCCAFSEVADFDFFGFVFIFNIEPNINEMLKNKIGIQLISQFRVYLPMEQLVICIPIENENTTIPEKQIKSFLNTTSVVRAANHIGSRKGFDTDSSKLQHFIEAYPPDRWKNIVRKAEKQAKEKAIKKLIEMSDLRTAKLEMRRIINGYMAECLYLEKDDSIVENKRNEYSCAYKALSNPEIRLDSVCLMRVKDKNELH